MTRLRSTCIRFGSSPGAGNATGESLAKAGGVKRGSGGRRWTAPVLLVAFALASVLALAEPVDTACWRPGTAPGLFSWSAAPGIACRDSAESGDILPETAVAATMPQAEAGVAPAGEAARVTFSGTAYVGVAVAF